MERLYVWLAALTTLALYWGLGRDLRRAGHGPTGWAATALGTWIAVGAALPMIPDDMGPPPIWFSDTVPGVGVRAWAWDLCTQLAHIPWEGDPLEIMDTDGYYHMPATVAPLLAALFLVRLHILGWRHSRRRRSKPDPGAASVPAPA